MHFMHVRTYVAMYIHMHIAISKIISITFSYDRATCIDTFSYVTGPAITNHVSTKNCKFVSNLLYYNLITIYTITTKSFYTNTELMGILLQCIEMECYIQN